MKFEKINNDKIKITLNSNDLAANDVDLHSFMANPTQSESQSLFLTVLDKAERDFGFSTDNYNLRVETLALENGSFILTITRVKPQEAKYENPASPKKVKASRRTINMKSQSLLYKFNSFDDFCGFVNFLHNNVSYMNRFSRTAILYSFNDFYYLLFEKINPKYEYKKIVYSAITEFATYVNPADSFIAKIRESGKVVMNNNAIRICERYFIKNL
jgi:negative regulator of genetic competence, sporulation and motility